MVEAYLFSFFLYTFANGKTIQKFKKLRDKSYKKLKFCNIETMLVTVFASEYIARSQRL